jgi:hypothetical protein
MSSKRNSGWNHRVLVTEHKGELYFQIHEVYYTKGKPDSYTANPVSLGADTIDGLRWTLKHMKKCLVKPALWGDDRFPSEYEDEWMKQYGEFINGVTDGVFMEMIADLIPKPLKEKKDENERH